MTKTRRLASQFEALAVLMGRLSNSVKSGLWRSPVGRRLWQGPSGPLTYFYPQGLRPGDAARGALWLAGDYSLPGGLVKAPERAPLAITNAPTRWLASLHGFDWLAHLLAVPGDAGHAAARQALLDWAQSPLLGDALAMQPAIVGRRLSRWLPALGVLKNTFDSHETGRLHASFTDQARWLAVSFARAEEGIDRLRAALGLTLAGLARPDDDRMLRRGMDALMRELRRQILPDGGHISRAPDVLVDLLADLIAIESGLAARQITPPPLFGETLTRMQNMLVLLRHRDGTLGCFHGGLESSKAAIDAVLPRKNAGSKMRFAQKSGYQRLEAEHSCVLIDVGEAPPGAASVRNHAAPLAFEMSYADDKIIVNCGPNLVHGPDWQLAARGLPAHSTLAFDAHVTDPFMRHGFAARHLGPRLKPDHWQVQCRRVEDKTGIWLEMSHAMFLDTHGVRHNRRIFVDARGQDIRGEDLLLGDKNHVARLGAGFHLRFHLHPDIRASLQGGGNNVLLLGRSGHGWQFRTASGTAMQLRVEESVYMGKNGVPQRSRQLAIQGQLGHTDTMIRWALRYAGRSTRARATS